MGSGKSSVGRLLASKLGFRFVDTDQLVIEANRMPISQIFERFGEAFFRKEETKALESLLGNSGLVVATGGGIVTQPANVPILKKLGRVVWLTANEAVIFERVSRNTKRPLLQTENPRETVHRLMTERLPYYEAVADCSVDGTHQSHEQVATQVIQLAQTL